MADINPILLSRFSQLQAAARAAGFDISIGSGYRTVEEQIALRKANGCPDIWNSPASSCRVPTAIPGTSNHNHGLAIDIAGSKEAKRWANQHGAEFGLHFPVPGEDWHVELIDDDEAGAQVRSAMGRGAIGFNINWMEEANPEDELANRLHAIMRITGQPAMKIDTPKDLIGVPEEAGLQEIQVDDPDEAWEMSLATINPGADPASRPVAGSAVTAYQAFARSQLKKFGWSDDEMDALVELWNRESNWNPNAQNPNSTAYGIAQFLNGTWEGTGYKKTSNPTTQILAGLTYIKGRYGSPSNALQFHNRMNWY